MPTITKILSQKRRPNRRSVYLDGTFAFGCNLNVIARFRLREGLQLTAEQVDQIQRGEIRQECFDAAMRYLQSRMHSRRELKTKLMRKEIGGPIIDAVLDDLARMNYLNDARFATDRAAIAARRKHQGPRRAMMELLRAGVKSETAKKAVAEVYETSDSVTIAMNLAERQSARLKKLDPQVARRRLAGMLMRRGFDFETVKPVIEKILDQHEIEPSTDTDTGSAAD